MNSHELSDFPLDPRRRGGGEGVDHPRFSDFFQASREGYLVGNCTGNDQTNRSSENPISNTRAHVFLQKIK